DPARALGPVRPRPPRREGDRRRPEGVGRPEDLAVAAPERHQGDRRGPEAPGRAEGLAGARPGRHGPDGCRPEGGGRVEGPADPVAGSHQGDERGSAPVQDGPPGVPRVPRRLGPRSWPGVTLSFATSAPASWVASPWATGGGCCATTPSAWPPRA